MEDTHTEAPDPRVQLIAAAIEARLTTILDTVGALTEAVGLLDRVDDQRGEQIAGLYAIVKAQGETITTLMLDRQHSVRA